MGGKHIKPKETPQMRVSKPARREVRTDEQEYQPRRQRIDWQEDMEVSQPRQQPVRQAAPRRQEQVSRVSAAAEQPQRSARPAVTAQQPQRTARPAAEQPPRNIRPVTEQPQRTARPTAEQPQRTARPAVEQPSRNIRPVTEQPQRTARPAAERPVQRRPARQVPVEPPRPYRPPKRRFLSKQNMPIIVLVVILMLGVLIAGGKLASILLNYQRDRSAYDKLADAAISGLAEAEATPNPDEIIDSSQAASLAPFEIDWDYLKGVNSDVVGWLYSPNGAINYPVMQTTDNVFYLRRGFNKEDNTSGSLYANPVSTIGVIHSNYIVYGHNMKDGSMFASIEKYVDQNYYNEYPYMYFLTPGGNYRVDLIAAHIVESTLNNYPEYFQSDWDYQTYLNQITSSSYFGTSASVSGEYQLFTMSTCDYSGSFNDPRFLLHGLLIPIQ